MQTILKDGPRTIRDRLDALEWVRREMFRISAPDQIRERVAESRVQAMCAALIRGPAKGSGSYRR
jgi:hypothetical protein